MTLSIDVLVKYGSIILGIVFFLIPFFIGRNRNKKFTLTDLLVIGVSASSVPTGLALIYCAFKPSELSKLTNVGTYIAFAGLALLYIAVSAIKTKLRNR